MKLYPPQNNYISHVINWLIYGNFWISTGSIALTHASSLVLGLKLDWKIYALAFFGTLCTYNLTAFYVSKPISRKFIFMEKHRQTLQLFSVFSGIFSLILAVFSGLETVLFLAHLGFISLFYTIPLDFRLPFLKPIKLGTLRQIPYLKIILVGYVWASVSVILPLLSNLKLLFQAKYLGLFIVQFLFIIAITLPFDIRDFRTDKKTGLKTLAQKNIQRTKFSGISLLTINILVISFLFPIQLYFSFFMTYFLAGSLIFYASPKRPELYYTGWIDGTIILQTLLLILIEKIT